MSAYQKALHHLGLEVPDDEFHAIDPTASVNRWRGASAAFERKVSEWAESQYAVKPLDVMEQVRVTGKAFSKMNNRRNDFRNEAMEWGTRMEPVALRLLEHHLPLPATSNLFSPVTPFGFITHDKHPWLGASIDGVLGDGTIVEVKCPQTYGKVGLNVPPELIYWVQIQIQLETLSLPRAILYKSQFVKYPNIDMWLADTSTLFKGLHLLPRKENIEPIDYQNGNGEEVDFVSPPEEVVPWMVDQPMPPKSRNGNWLEGPTVGGTYDWSVDGLGRPEYDYGRMVEWLTHTMSGRDAGEVCKPILWGLESWTVQEVLRDEEWFRGVRPVLREWWEKIREEVQVRRRGDGVQKSGVDRIEASMGSFRQVLGS